MFIGDAYETYTTDIGSQLHIYAAYSVGYDLENFNNPWGGAANFGYILPTKESMLCITPTYYFIDNCCNALVVDGAVEILTPDNLNGNF